MTQFKRKTDLCQFRCNIWVNLSFNRAITRHLSTIGLYTLNVCSVKFLFKRRNYCRLCRLHETTLTLTFGGTQAINNRQTSKKDEHGKDPETREIIFKILEKYLSKPDCLIFEMLFIRELKKNWTNSVILSVQKSLSNRFTFNIFFSPQRF